MGQRSLTSLAQLQQHLRQMAADHHGANRTACEVDLDFDYQLKYQFLMEAMTAISGRWTVDGERWTVNVDGMKDEG